MSGGIDEDTKAKFGRPKKEPVQVKYTGGWSLDSKISSIFYGYWEDPFMSFFNNVESIPRRTSLICRGYYVRFRVCDFFLRSVLEAAKEPMQVISLGCGMDTSFFRLLPQFSEDKIAKFFELDFESTILAKKHVIESNELLQIMANDKLVLLSADLRNIPLLNEVLTTAGFQPDLPTLIYSECVVNYLQPHESEALLKWAVDKVPRCIWLAYEQCYPNDSFGKIMMKHFDKNGCSLLSLPENPDMKAQKKQLQNVGFDMYKIFNAFDSFLYLTRNDTLPFPKISNHQFDEYEALLATCLHYSVRIGTCGNIDGSVAEFISSTSSAISSIKKPKFSQDTIILNHSNNDSTKNNIFIFTSDIKLSGHAAVSLNANELLLLGGTKGSSNRSTSLEKITIKAFGNDQQPSLQIHAEKVKDDRRYFERIHSIAVFHEPTSSFYIFGGRLSPQEPCSHDLIQVYSGSSYIIKALSFPKESAPSARWRHAMVATTNSLILFGGKNQLEIFGDCWSFQFSEGRWEEKNWTRMPQPRHSHSMSVDNKRQHIYCVGGMLEDDTTLSLDAVWKFDFSDPTEEHWTNLPNLAIYGRRLGHSTIVHNDVLFIVGGYGAHSGYSLQHFVTLIHLDNYVIRVFDLEQSPANSLFIPFGCSVTMVKDDSGLESIVVYGGGENLFSFGSFYNEIGFIWRLDPSIMSYFQ